MLVGAEPMAKPWPRLLKWLVESDFLLLAMLLLVIFLHAATSVAILSGVAGGVAAVLAVLSVATVVEGVAFAWKAYPQHRTVTVFIVGLTLATLLAHAYVMGQPAGSVPGTVTGQPGSTFNDDAVSVRSTLAGSQLSVTVTDSGTNAIGGLTLSANGVGLTDGSFTSPPTMANPLLPGDSASGAWTLPTGQASMMSVQYEKLPCYDTANHVYGCIMDEVYYVPAAQHLLAGGQCSTTADRNAVGYCNPEHPFLTKALIAAGMAVFGIYSTVGWRFMIGILGTFSIPLLFGLAWKLSGSKKVASVAALLLALDVMFFSQSGGALLDIPPVFFGLTAFFAYVADLKWWKFDRYVVAGVLLGVSALAKETAIFTVMALATFIFFFGEGRLVARTYSVLKVGVVVMAVFAVGMQAFDSTMASAAFPTFVQQVSYMLHYGSTLIAKQLACQPVTGYWCKFTGSPGGPPILPTDWLVYYNPVGYYVVSDTVNPGNITFVQLGYYGVTNLLETWTTFVWLPLLGMVLYGYYRSRKLEGDETQLERLSIGVPGDARLAAFTIVYFGWMYVPYLLLSAVGRVTYPFYFVDAIPAVALGGAFWTTRDWFPRKLLYVYLAMVFVFFLIYFPDKAFLPIWVRALLRH